MEFKTVEEIFAFLDKTRGKVLEAAVTLSNEQADFSPAPGKWAAREIVEHLAKTEANLLRVVAKLLGKAEAVNIAAKATIDPPVSFGEIGQKIAGQKFEAPEFIKPAGGISIAESIAEMEKSRAGLKAMRARLEAVDLSNAQYPHPYFGMLNGYYWLAFIGFHELHHLRQLQAVVAEFESLK